MIDVFHVTPSHFCTSSPNNNVQKDNCEGKKKKQSKQSRDSPKSNIQANNQGVVWMTSPSAK